MASLDLHKIIPGLPKSLSGDDLASYGPDALAKLIKTLQEGGANLHTQSVRAESEAEHAARLAQERREEAMTKYGTDDPAKLAEISKQRQDEAIAAWSELEGLMAA